MSDAKLIEQALRRDVDANASVRPLNVRLNPFLAGAYKLYEAELLGTSIAIAQPKDDDTGGQRLVTRASALTKSLGRPVALHLTRISRQQRRSLIEARQGFITTDGSYYLPQLSLILSGTVAGPIDITRPFTPMQQAVFLHCLYASQPIELPDVQSALGVSSGSASSALSELVRLGLLECSVGGKTGRKKSYRVRDKKEFFDSGLGHFGSPVREVIEAPSSIVKDDWLKSGLSALSEVSDLLPPKLPEYAITRKQTKAIPANPDESMSRCIVKVLKYDPLPFANGDRVDPATMLLTIDESGERVSIALRQALEGQEWYQG